MGVYTVHAGHAKQGNAYSGASGIYMESVENRKIKDAVIKYLKQAGHTVYDCTVDSGTSQSNIINQIKNKINSYSGVTANISIHLNCYNGSAKGIECCVYENAGMAADIGKRICANISSAGFVNRGNKSRTDLGVLKGITNGGANVLVETFFCDNKSDCELYQNIGSDGFGKLIAEGILNTKIGGSTSSVQSNTQIGTVQLYEDNGTYAQKWVKYNNKDGTVSFENVATGLFLDVDGASNKSGATVQVYTLNSSIAQKWKIKDNGSVKRIVSAINDNLSLDVEGAVSDNGGRIQLFPNNTSRAQTWELKEVSRDIYKIINVGTGKALDVAGGIACGRNDNYSKPFTQTTVTTSTDISDKIVSDGLIHANNFCKCGTDKSQISKIRGRVLQHALNLDYKAGLAEDGIVKEKTLAALGNHYVKKGETQYLVTAVEILLMLKGYNPNGVENPGKFGSELEKCVLKYQNDNDLTPDKVAGAKTIKSLIN